MTSVVVSAIAVASWLLAFAENRTSMAILTLPSLASALVLAFPAVALAQSEPARGAPCPPGSWFCTPAPHDDAAPPEPPAKLQPLPDPDAPDDLEAYTTELERVQPQSLPDPVAPSSVATVSPEASRPCACAAPPNEPASGREWGVNVHFEAASLGGGAAHNEAMAGGGMGLRFKPSRYFGLETDLDIYGGRGYVGDLRQETALTFNGLLFLNPKSLAQVYLLSGFGWSWANSERGVDDTNDPSAPQPYNYSYSYFGGQAGIGVELRLSQLIALNVDLRGFVRTRTDALAASQPEFTNAQGQTTNTSAGGLLTGGLTFYAR